MEYWPRLQRLVARYPDVTALQAQWRACCATRDAIIQHQLPATGLPRLGLAPTDWMFRPTSNARELRATSHLLTHFRWYIAYHYGVWAFITADLMDAWVHEFPHYRYLEVGAGNGLISFGLRQRHVPVICTDTLSWTRENATGRAPWTKVEPLAASAALWRYGDQVDAVIMSWMPDKDPNDAALLRQIRTYFPHLHIFCVGERAGLTDSQLFWSLAHRTADRRLLKLNRYHRQFDGVNDKIYLIS
ncbi:class I SAM-dependent methyltransferase [Lacticaseibacillus thailandensis]|uniref:SAM-dependent methyltransferase n=1 Tax=Lacticaseibacillus thailandensis DSM 22698 = JCM 13996 TaxID=1423810 RepID=A0A0R2CIP5_9LACO|nr:class I SAM-dependent methyltransferase [Lacticaseibacillus thailandensis]KRM88124.1 SAM-dependent methyltransferase [Lacticaseibacillus thailandensis DSM 22698 = JCM 13996]